MDHSPYGLHRVIRPPGVLPQRAEKLDTSLPIRRGEILIDVERLNLDAASYHQLVEETGGHPDELKARVIGIVRERGKMHNPVTGSGGMLIGTVSAVGDGRQDVAVGTRLATLVSLTLTPLVLYSIAGWDGLSEQVPAEGYAILFESGIFAPLPEDLPDALSLAVLDVGGAGKSGLLCLYAARGRSEEVVGLVHHREGLDLLRSLGFDAFLADATDPVGSLEAAREATGGGGGGVADLVINCVSVPGTEGASILLTEEGGTLYFFSMATSFTAAALAAEGVGRDVTMIIGS